MNIYIFLIKLILVLFLPTPIFPLVVFLTTLAATYSVHNNSFLEIVISIFRCELIRIEIGLALLWIALAWSRFILIKIQSYLENVLQPICIVKAGVCFVLYSVAIIIQFFRQKFRYSMDNEIIVCLSNLI
jgi:hypothetical protein